MGPNAIGNSRITFHLFFVRELFLVVISSGFTSKNLAELFLVEDGGWQSMAFLILGFAVSDPWP